MTCPRIMTEAHDRGPGGPGVTHHTVVQVCTLEAGHDGKHEYSHASCTWPTRSVQR